MAFLNVYSLAPYLLEKPIFLVTYIENVTATLERAWKFDPETGMVCYFSMKTVLDMKD